MAEYGKMYRKTHKQPTPSPEKKIEYGKKYYRKHREAILERLKNDIGIVRISRNAGRSRTFSLIGDQITDARGLRSI